MTEVDGKFDDLYAGIGSGDFRGAVLATVDYDERGVGRAVNGGGHFREHVADVPFLFVRADRRHGRLRSEPRELRVKAGHGLIDGESAQSGKAAFFQIDR